MHRYYAIGCLAGVLTLAAPPLVDVAVGQACHATFSATEAGITDLDPSPRLLVSGHFRAPDRRDPILDLAYVSTQNVDKAPRQVLSVLLSSGNGCFRKPTNKDGTTPRPIVVGEQPRLMTSGDFDGDGISDLAIVDALVDQFNPSPTVRILMGAGEGLFKPGPGIDIVALGEGERPIAIAPGAFRTLDKPVLDLAIVSAPATPSPVSRGVLRILFNNGSGEFTPAPTAPISLGDFEPAAMAAGVFRNNRRVDLVIKEAATVGRRRLLYLRNAGNATFPTKQAIDGAGEVAAIVLGPMQSRDASGAVDDVITFDKDMTIRVFASDGQGQLNRLDPLNEQSAFGFAGDPQFFGVRNEGEPLQLIAAAARHSNPGARGMLVLTSDESGHFEIPQFRAFRRVTIPAQQGSATFDRVERPVPSKERIQTIEGRVVGRFLNADFGNRKPDLVFAAHDEQTETRVAPCARSVMGGGRERSDGPILKPPGVVCRGASSAIKCLDRVFCEDKPVNGRCTCTCDSGPTDPQPDTSGCRIKTVFPPVLIVVGNPFGR